MADELRTGRLLRRWRREGRGADDGDQPRPRGRAVLNRPVADDAIGASTLRDGRHWEQHGFGAWAVEVVAMRSSSRATSSAGRSRARRSSCSPPAPNP